jgi:hypothetical protein
VIQDGFQDDADVLVDVLVGVADDVIVLLLQPSCACLVVFDLIRVGVAVDLDDQAPIAQVGPELELGGCLRVAKLAWSLASTWLKYVYSTKAT